MKPVLIALCCCMVMSACDRDEVVDADVGVDVESTDDADNSGAGDSGRDATIEAGQDAEADDDGDADVDDEADDGRPRIGDIDDEGRALVWADEFDGPEIDRTIWGNEIGLVRNQEEQYYTDDPANQYVDDGNLVIAGLPGGHDGQGNYTSASLTTEGNMAFMYGRLEARIRVPEAAGSWPAFWLLPVNKDAYAGLPPFGSWWPAGGEIDVMEYVSQTPNTVYGTIHFLENDEHGSNGISHEMSDPIFGDYHLFAIEWTSTTIEWFVDDVHFHTADISQPIDGRTPFNDSFYVILNYAIGGTWPEDPASSQYPDFMRIDWIRYWN